MGKGGFSVERISNFFEYIYYFLGINIWFIVSNIPVILFFFVVGIDQTATYLPLFLLCILPVAPALSAVFFSMHRLVQGKESGVIKDYIKGYKSNLLQSVQIAIIQIVSIFILYNNINFFKINMPIFPIVIIFVIIFILVILMTPNLYLLLVRYKMKNLDLIKTALALTIGKPVLTLGNLAALGIILIVFELSAGTTVLFMGSIYGFLIVFMNRRLLQTLES